MERCCRLIFTLHWLVIMKTINALIAVAVLLGISHYALTIYVEHSRMDRFAAPPSSVENHSFTAAPTYDQDGNRKLNHAEGWQ